jgi:tripartite-type tricarboxylate transporter receptor subunit TctC
VAPLSFGAFAGPAGLPADVKRKLAEGCEAAARSEAYVALAKRSFQPTDYYGDAATLADNMEKDVAEKRRLLTALGIMK